MGRLIDVVSIKDLPPAVMLQVGDLLLVRATGGRVLEGAETLQALGSFGAAALAPDGQVLAATGGPAAVAFLARMPGTARIEVMRGDPFGGPRSAVTVAVTVEAGVEAPVAVKGTLSRR
ncbi:hypothetical protein ACFQX4_20730 [Roseomonas sp. GCM10028921]